MQFQIEYCNGNVCNAHAVGLSVNILAEEESGSLSVVVNGVHIIEQHAHGRVHDGDTGLRIGDGNVRVDLSSRMKLLNMRGSNG